MSDSRSGSLFGRLLLLFTLVPIVELSLLVWLGGQIGFWPTVGIIAATALLGSWLAHREGLAAWQRFQGTLSSGEMPSDALTDGIIILIAGALLLTPGVLTDLVGFTGLFPPTRALIKRAVTKRIKRGTFGGVHVATWPPPASDPPDEMAHGETVDVDYEEVPRESLPQREAPGEPNRML